MQSNLRVSNQRINRAVSLAKLGSAVGIAKKGCKPKSSPVEVQLARLKLKNVVERGAMSAAHDYPYISVSPGCSRCSHQHR